MQTYSQWHAIAVASGASGLSEITDATSPDDPFGTDSNASYWEGHAYDQLRALYLELGSSPGAGASGNFTINDDNSSADAEDSFLYFHRGSAQGGNAYIRWNSAETYLETNFNFIGTGKHLGESDARWAKFWGVAADISGALDVGGAVTLTSTLDVTGQVQTR